MTRYISLAEYLWLAEQVTGIEAGSVELRRLYVDPAEAGVPWLLDPDNDFVRQVLASYEDRQPTEECDPEALASDLDDAVLLIRQRHIGIAEGEFAGIATDAALEQWVEGWKQRLRSARPTTWGQAIGLDGHRLRRILGDSHCNIHGEDPEQLQLVDPRRHQPLLHDPGPVAEVFSVGDVLCVRVRELFGSPEDVALLQQWADGHADHFKSDKIIVDLRGDGGGSDDFVLNWIEAHIPDDVALADETYTWQLGDHLLAEWNFGVLQRAMYDTPFPLTPTRPLGCRSCGNAPV